MRGKVVRPSAHVLRCTIGSAPYSGSRPRGWSGLPRGFSIRLTAYYEYGAVAGGEHARKVPPVLSDKLDMVEGLIALHDRHAFANAIAYVYTHAFRATDSSRSVKKIIRPSLAMAGRGLVLAELSLLQRGPAHVTRSDLDLEPCLGIRNFEQFSVW